MDDRPNSDRRVERLLRALAGGDAAACRAACRAAIRSLDPATAAEARVAAALVGLLTGPDLEAREDAAAALVRAGRPAVEPLLAAARSADPDARRAAVVVLGRVGPAAGKAVPALRELTADEAVGPWAARALAAIEHPGHARRPGWWVAAVAAVAALAAGVAASVAQSAVGGWPGPAVTAGVGLGGVGVLVGLAAGLSAGGLRRAVLLAVMCGVGGATAGAAGGWVVSALVGPVNRVLGG
jgi:hypothetical protein